MWICNVRTALRDAYDAVSDLCRLLVDNLADEVAACNRLVFGDCDTCDSSTSWRTDDALELHGRDGGQGVTDLDVVSGLDLDVEDDTRLLF